jgi:hypothetical protein
MDWATIRPALLALIGRLSDVPGVNVVWEDQPRPFVNAGVGNNPPAPGDRAQILCSIKNVRAQGQDECATDFLGFPSDVVAGVFQGLPTAQQVADTPLWFTELAPAPFALNTEYFVVGLSGSTFSLAASPGGSPISPTDSDSTGAVLSWSAPGTEMQDTYSGIRLFVFQLRCESFEQEDGLVAHQYLEEIRQRLYRKTSVDALLATNVTWYDSNDQTQDVDAAADDRMNSIAVLPLHMRAAVDEVDPNRYGYVVTTSTSSSVGP